MSRTPDARPPGPANPPDSPAGGDRLATALRRLRWPVLIAWVLAAVLLYPLAHSLVNLENNTATANLQASAQSTRVVTLQQDAQPGRPEIDTATVVLARGKGLTAADLAAASAAHAAVASLAGHDGLSAPGPAQRSADGQAVQFTAQITSTQASEDSTDNDAVGAIRAAVAGPTSRAGDGLQAAVTGSAAVNADSDITTSTNVLLLTTLVIIAVILLLVYRSPVLWLLPLIGSLAAIDTARAAGHGLVNAGLTVNSLSYDIMTVLVIGASTDYALLLVHRYREELRRHGTTEEAMAAALRRTAPTLLASAGTVICAMLCLLAANSQILRGLGPIGAVAIAAALLAQVTLLPALLLACGRPVFWPRIPRPGQPGRDESRVWTAVGARVARHPARVTVATVILLGAACVGLAAAHSDNNPVATVPGHPGSVTGNQLLTEHFPAADHDPLNVLAPPGEAAAAASTARATPGVAAVSSTAPVEGYAAYDVTLSAANYSAGAYDAIATLRANLGRAAPGSLVGGDQAVQYDITQAAHRDNLLLIPLVLAVTFVIIALLLRALVAPLVLVLTTALSFGASFGLSTLLWRYGLGYSGVESELPLLIFVFLIALGVDYNIFLAARVREEAVRTDITRATLRGLGTTGGVITAAGIVLAATFANIARLPQVPITEVGSAIAIGILLDTFLVRTVLVPASLLTIGERVWWPARAPRSSRHRAAPLAQEN